MATSDDREATIAQAEHERHGVSELAHMPAIGLDRCCQPTTLPEAHHMQAQSPEPMLRRCSGCST